MSIHIDKKFEFPGSISHFSPRLKFTIRHMYLKIKPDFGKKTAFRLRRKINNES